MTRVIIVDDDRDIRATLRLVLEDDGYAIDDASDGHKGLQVLRASRTPGVVLLDLMMPGLDGMGVLEAVAAEADLQARYRFVLMTAAHLTFPLKFVHLLTDLAVPVLRKPLDIDELARVVDRAAQHLPTSS